MNRIQPRNDSEVEREENYDEVLSEETGGNMNVSHSTTELHCSGANVEDHEIFTNLWESTHILTNSMRLFGQYFECNPQMSGATNLESNLNKFSRYYSLSMVILQWLNLVRFLTVFTKENHFDASLFERLQYVIWRGLSASMLTCMYAACKTGKLSKATMNIESASDGKWFLRKRTVIVSLLAWVVFSIFGFADIMNYVVSDDFAGNDALTPLYTLISPNELALLVMKPISLLTDAYTNANITFLTGFNLIFTMTVTREFCRLNGRLKTIIRTRRQPETAFDVICFENGIAEQRKLAKRVRQFDYFFSGFNGSVILSDVGLLILAFYNLCWYPNSNATVARIVASIYYIILFSVQLLVVTVGSMLVNHTVSHCFFTRTLTGILIGLLLTLLGLGSEFLVVTQHWN